VEAGDSLLGIALRFETTVEMLELLNGLSDPEVVQIGQVLTVPPPQVSLESVDPSQTLREIAPRHNLDAVTLAAYNGRGPQDIDTPLGRDKLIVPERSGTAEGRPAAAAGATAANVYTVEEGDTMSSIAEKLDVDLDALKAANGRDDPDLIAVGEELRIPRSD
jgi:LysM repeat protein